MVNQHLSYRSDEDGHRVPEDVRMTEASSASWSGGGLGAWEPVRGPTRSLL